MKNILILITLLMVVITTSFSEESDPKTILERGKELLGIDQSEAEQLINESVSIFKQKLKKDKKDYNSAYHIGMAFFYMQKDEKASQYYNKAIEIAPDSAAPYFMNGVIAMYGKDYKKAVNDIKKAVSLSPEKPKYWLEYGRALSNASNLNDAMRAYENAVHFDEKLASGWYNIGVIYQKRNDNMKAFEMFEKALAVDSTCGNAAYNLGQMFQLKGEHEKSLLYFSKAYDVDSNDWRALSKIIQTQHALGDSAAVEKTLEKIYTLKKSGKVRGMERVDYFSREQFVVEDKQVLAIEHFELKGDRAVKIVFEVYDKNSKDYLYRISLGSYDATNSVAQSLNEVKDGKRLYHLDGYYSSGHSTFGFFEGQPSYYEIRKKVVSIIEGKGEAISGTVRE